MGGSVGLKGTDGDMYARAVQLGAEPVSPQRTRDFLHHVDCMDRVRLLVGPGPMGEALVGSLDHEVIGELGEAPGRADTRKTARAMLAAGAELIVFAGGDGTARDMIDAIGQQLPVIAIPAGVKIYSSVFAYNPRAAAELLSAFVQGADVSEEEVLDIDEDAFRKGRVDSHHYGFLLVPEVAQLLQDGKESSDTKGSTAAAKQDLASAVVETMESGVLYLLGSGTTLRHVATALGVEKTLLGIDAVIDGQLVARDCNEKDLLALLEQYDSARIIVTPLGGNGFLFGRGNKQFTPAVLNKVGEGNVIVIANREKLLRLERLHVDTGDADVDSRLRGYVKVVVGRGHQKLMPVE
jgi:predicted polyphosphate/ATP-dependent NAD kinase